MKSTVGKSDRTFGKHKLLNAIVGREAGIIALRRPKFLELPWYIYDLCAGDGQQTIQSGTSSAAILLKHHHHVNIRADARLILIERDPNTFATLQSSYGHLPKVSVVHGDARYYSMPPEQISLSNPVFFHNDPNTVHDWALTGRLLLSAGRFTTTLSTLGCNVGGLKQLSHAERLQWFDHINSLLQVLPPWHDAALCCLKGDAAQWAYLITGPVRWRESYEQDLKNAFSYWTQGYELAWYRKGNDFYGLVQKLFLRKGELVCV